jgi:hypothetical protein
MQMMEAISTIIMEVEEVVITIQVSEEMDSHVLIQECQTDLSLIIMNLMLDLSLLKVIEVMVHHTKAMVSDRDRRMDFIQDMSMAARQMLEVILCEILCNCMAFSTLRN